MADADQETSDPRPDADTPGAGVTDASGSEAGGSDTDGAGSGTSDAGASDAAHRRPGRARPASASSPRMRGALVVPALLVVALVLLVVGLVTSVSAWLAASLVASVLAAVLLVVERLVQRRRGTTPAQPASSAARGDDTAAEPDPELPIDLDAPAIDPDDPEAVWVVDGRPRYHARDCATIASLTAEPIARSQALEDGFVACSLCSPSASPAG